MSCCKEKTSHAKTNNNTDPRTLAPPPQPPSPLETPKNGLLAAISAKKKKQQKTPKKHQKQKKTSFLAVNGQPVNNVGDGCLAHAWSLVGIIKNFSVYLFRFGEGMCVHGDRHTLRTL